MYVVDAAYPISEQVKWREHGTIGWWGVPQYYANREERMLVVIVNSFIDDSIQVHIYTKRHLFQKIYI